MTDVTCSVEGCDRQVRAKGWCARHYQRAYLKGDPGPAGLINNPAPPTCTVDGCERPTVARGYCEMHRWRVRTYGEPGEAAPRQTRPSRRRPGGICSVDGCGRDISERGCDGMCRMHYERVRRTGDPGPAVPLIKPRGAGHLREDGYIRLNLPGGRRVLEHVHVMEQMLGRRLVAPENVHHLNGQRDDNRPENLELWVVTQPSGQRLSDLMEYIAEYHADAMRELLKGR